MTEISITISNVGGIDHYEQTFSDGVTVITGANASNKTSLLQAIAFGFGRSTVPIRSGASEARVELEVGDHHVVRTAKPKGRGISISGDVVLDSDDAELFERFGCLFEFNEIRQAIREDRSVEELLKEPMDLNALENERSNYLEQKHRLKEEVDQLADTEQEIESRKVELSATRERIEELEAQLDDLREQQAKSTGDDEELERLREERASLVHDRKEYERQIDELEDAIDRLETDLDDTKSNLEEAREEAESYDVEALQTEREEVRRDLDDIVDRVEVLQSVLTANREMLDSSYTGVLGKESSLMEDTVTCWACGDNAAVAEFEETVDELTDLIENDKQRRHEYQPRLDEIESKIETAKQAERHVSDLEGEVSELEASLENRRQSLETKRESLEDLRTELDDLDDRLAEQESEQTSEVTGLQEQIEGVRVDLHSAQSEADRLESLITDLQERLEERERKKAEIDRLTDEITTLTDRIQRLEQDLREGFNDAISDLIEVLDYERIERIWLDGEFNLIVAREVDGVVREDEVTHLSESEREMVGLMLALAGYVAYDVAELDSPLLLDTLGAFDSERTAKLISYFADETPYLITALLPDSASTVHAASYQNNVVEPTPRSTAQD